MITVEELMQKWPRENISPYGDCIVIPGAEFDPDWEVFLGEQGYRCINTDHQGRKVTLVKLKQVKLIPPQPRTEPEPEVKTKPENEMLPSSAEFPWSDEDEQRLIKRMGEVDGTVYQRAEILAPEFQGRSVIALRIKFYKLTGLKGSSKRKARPRPTMLHTPWQPEEDEKLIELWNKRLTRHVIAESFPERGDEAVQNRLKRLAEVGRIKPRWKQKKKKKKKETTDTSETSSVTHEVAATTPATPSLSKSIDNIMVLLKELLETLKSPSFSFDYACSECGETGTVCESDRIWRVCPVCGKPLHVWNVETS